MKNQPLQFDISKSEPARWLANLIAEFQGKGVLFTITQDANLVYVEVN